MISRRVLILNATYGSGFRRNRRRSPPAGCTGSSGRCTRRWSSGTRTWNTANLHRKKKRSRERDPMPSGQWTPLNTTSKNVAAARFGNGDLIARYNIKHQFRTALNSESTSAYRRPAWTSGIVHNLELSMIISIDQIEKKNIVTGQIVDGDFYKLSIHFAFWSKRWCSYRYCQRLAASLTVDQLQVC